MKQITVSIGNSDNKLTQVEWSDFVSDVNADITYHSKKIHFFGGASNWEPWQNVCWIFDCDEKDIPAQKTILAELRKKYRQDSIAYLEGEIEFL